MKRSATLLVLVLMLCACQKDLAVVATESKVHNVQLSSNLIVANLVDGVPIPAMSQGELCKLFLPILGLPATSAQIIQVDGQYFLKGKYEGGNIFFVLDLDAGNGKFTAGGAYIQCSGSSCNCDLNGNQDCVCSAGSGSGTCTKTKGQSSN